MKVLVNEKTNVVLNVGDEIITFRGEQGVLVHKTEPKHEGSTGRVGVILHRGKLIHEFYPSVIGAKWVQLKFSDPSDF